MFYLFILGETANFVLPELLKARVHQEIQVTSGMTHSIYKHTVYTVLYILNYTGFMFSWLVSVSVSFLFFFPKTVFNTLL